MKTVKSQHILRIIYEKAIILIHNNKVKPTQYSKEINITKAYAMVNKYTSKVLLVCVIFFLLFFVNYVYSPSLQINIPNKIAIKMLNLMCCGLFGFSFS